MKKRCLQCEGVDNLFPSAIKRAITREQLSSHCQRKTCGEASRDLDLDLIQVDDITLDYDTNERFEDLSVTALMSMSEHMGMFGMGALSPDDKGDDGEENLGAPKDEDDENDDKGPGQVAMYVCFVCCCHKVAISEWWKQSHQEPPPVPPTQVVLP